MSIGVQAFVRRLPWPEILILLLAAVLRFAALELKPPHFDEGINGWFADQMTKNGFYKYDPTNYHGPLHMYAVFVAQKLLGREVWALRLPVVLVSLACVWQTLRFGRFFGSHAARWAALAMAVSPAAVFYGRYSIHESWLVLFLMLTAWGVLEIWKNGTRAGLYATVAGFTGMVLTKETYFIHVGCLLLAFPALWLWQLLSPSRPAQPIAPKQWTFGNLGLSIFLGALAIVFFYSGTFLNWSGVAGLYQTYAAWFDTGVEKGHHAKTQYDLLTIDGEKGPTLTLNWYYLALIARYEWPAAAGLLACLRLLWPAPAQIRWVVIAGAGALVAYSLIPYKTPWLVLPMLWPFWMAFGALMQELRAMPPAVFPGAAAVAGSLVMGLNLNFREYDNPRQPYVYVQTHRSIHKLVDPMFEIARRNPAAHQFICTFHLDSYYPLPWWLGDFANIAYPGGSPESRVYGEVIVAEKSKAGAVERNLDDRYVRREFRLRDAQEDCYVWFREETFGEMMPGEPVVGPEAKNP